MKRSEFDSHMKTILGVDELKPTLTLDGLDSFSRVEIIILIEQFIGRELEVSKLKEYKSYQDILGLIGG